MIFEVKRFSDMRELRVEDGNTTLVTGFMDREESREMAARLISAAEDLLYGDMSLEEFLEGES